MATIKEIQKMVKADPSLINKIPHLKEFINQHREDFGFLFKDEPKNLGSSGNAGKNLGSSGNAGKPIKSVVQQETNKDYESKKWNPKITQI